MMCWQANLSYLFIEVWINLLNGQIVD